MTTHEAVAGDLELSLVVPAYNEEANIGGVIELASGYLDRCGIRYEINVVDDGSVDGTAEVLARLCQSSPRLRIVRHPCNLGYGAAVRSGIAASRGKHILVSDGDGQFRIEDLPVVWDRRHEADLVLGFRNPRKDSRVRRIAGWVYSRVLVRWALGGRFRDVNCGFKLIARHVVEEMELLADGALISAELLTRARLAGATFIEVGVNHFPRARGSATGLLPRVVVRMVAELMRLRSRILATAGGRGRGGSGLRAGCDTVESASASAG